MDEQVNEARDNAVENAFVVIGISSRRTSSSTSICGLTPEEASSMICMLIQADALKSSGCRTMHAAITFE